MGLLDELGSLAGQLSQSSDEAKVAGGLVQALEQHPDGIQGLINSFTQNGMGDHITALASGAQQTTTPGQVQQGLQGSGLVEQVAAHAGVSPEIVQMAMTTVLPMVIQHFAPNGQATNQSDFGSLAQQLLGKFLA
ncbi:MAG TPA: YidB family protein [Granulicella sp.]